MKRTIRTERDAFEFLVEAIKQESGPDIEVAFSGWPSIKLDLKGDGYESSINPSLMEGLIKIQQGLNRSYAKIVEDRPDARYLKDEKKQQLEFMARVSQGSSKIEVDLSGFARKLIEDLNGRMTPAQAAVRSIVGATLWASNTMIKSYVAEQAEKSEAFDDLAKHLILTPEEAARISAIRRIMRRRPELKAIEEDARDASVALLRGCVGAESIQFNGLRLNRQEALLAVRSTRSDSVDTQLNGNYRILSVDTSRAEEIRIKIRGLDNNKEFFARFRDDSLDREHLTALQDAEWSKAPVYLSVNARLVRGEVTTATIVSATPQPK